MLEPPKDGIEVGERILACEFLSSSFTLFLCGEEQVLGRWVCVDWMLVVPTCLVSAPTRHFDDCDWSGDWETAAYLGDLFIYPLWSGVSDYRPRLRRRLHLSLLVLRGYLFRFQLSVQST